VISIAGSTGAGRLQPVIRRAVILLLACVLTCDIAVAGTFATRTTLLRNREFSEALLQGVRSARTSIVFSYFLFKTTDARSNLPQRIAEELTRAKKRGVDVTVLLERESGDNLSSLNESNHRTAAILSRAGIKVFFDSPRTTTHTKVAIIDSRYVYLGSHNLTQSALRHNNELSVLLDSPELAAEAKAYLDRL